MSYRLGAHSTSDDPSGYRSAEEEQQWRQKDPITRMKNWLIKQQWWQEEVDQELQKSFRSEILQELKVAEKRPKPALDTLISDVYKTPPAHLLRQLTDLESHVAKYPESYQMHGEGGR